VSLPRAPYVVGPENEPKAYLPGSIQPRPEAPFYDKQEKIETVVN